LSKVQALDSIEIIRRRPGMFIGSTETPEHLIEEVLDNALDEVTNNFATKVEFYFDSENNTIWISDNGRGIPVEPMEVDGEVRNSLEVLCTRLFSGTKFDLDDYETLLGQHGVGLVAVNALSDWLQVYTRDRKNQNKIHNFYFKNSILISSKIEEIPNYEYSTSVGFSPSQKYFEDIDLKNYLQKFVNRLVLTKAKFPNCDFIFNRKEIPYLAFENYVKSFLSLNESDKLYKLQYEKSSNNKIEVYLTYKLSSTTNTGGDVNLRTCTGTFINSFQTQLKKIIKNKISKKFKTVSEKEFLSGLNLYISLTIPEPKFDSQTKVRMVSNVKKSLIDPLEKQIDWFVSQKDIIQTIEENLNRKFEKKLVKTNSRSRSKRVSAGNKLRDCIYSPGDVLYVVEGDSADGTLKIIRDKKREASFPLKGKILNVETHSLQKINSNKEIQDLLEALGPTNKRRYKKVKILADADSDGLHISILAILFMQKFASDMIKDGNVSVILPPLYGAVKGKKYIPIYDYTLIEKYKQQGFSINRFKGLGEMNPEQLEVCIRSGIEYIVQLPETEEKLKQVLSIITDKDLKRALMNNVHCNYNMVMQNALNQKTQNGG